MTVVWELLHPEMTIGHLGFLLDWLDTDDPRSASDQIDAHYQHGGGWFPFKGHRLADDNSLQYPEDPPLQPLAQAQLRDELVVLYQHSWVAIIQKDRSFEVARID
jgi:hypothetical protein